jgi:hypothetical protein
MTQVFFPETERGVVVCMGSGTDCRNRSDGCARHRAPNGRTEASGTE